MKWKSRTPLSNPLPSVELNTYAGVVWRSTCAMMPAKQQISVPVCQTLSAADAGLVAK